MCAFSSGTVVLFPAAAFGGRSPIAAFLLKWKIVGVILHLFPIHQIEYNSGPSLSRHPSAIRQTRSAAFGVKKEDLRHYSISKAFKPYGVHFIFWIGILYF